MQTEQKVILDMPKVTIVRNEQPLIEVAVDKLTSLGFECEVPLTLFAQLRDVTGRIQSFEFFMEFAGVEEAFEGELTVYSMRRIAQDKGVLAARFKNLQPTLMTVINEYMHEGKVVSIQTAQLKRRA